MHNIYWGFIKISETIVPLISTEQYFEIYE